MPRRPVLAAVTALSVAVSTAFLGRRRRIGGTTADGRPDRGERRRRSTGGSTASSPATWSRRTGTVTAFVQLDAKSGSDVTADGGTPAEVKAAAADTEALADEVVPQQVTARSATSAAPKQIATLTNLVAGTLVTGDAAQVRALADSPDVVAVYRVTPKTATNAQQRRVHARAAGLAGHRPDRRGRPHRRHRHRPRLHARRLRRPRHRRGLRGGLRRPTAPARSRPGLFDPAKFIGGYDFAGPLYDATRDDAPGRDRRADARREPDRLARTCPTTAATARTSPAPPPGYGVLPDGTTFRGDYSEPDRRLRLAGRPRHARPARSSSRSRCSATSAARPTSRRSPSTAPPTRTATAT